jgi:general stress protein 26
MTAGTDRPAFDQARQLHIVRRAMARRSFCILATSSAANRPHAVGLLYAAVGFDIYLLIGSDTVKARNIRENPRVAVCIPVRTFPFAPPLAVQYQGTAQLHASDDPEIEPLLKDGRLKKITGLGALDTPGTVFVRVRPGRRITTYGLGMSIITLLRDVTQGARSVEIPPVPS